MDNNHGKELPPRFTYLSIKLLMVLHVGFIGYAMVMVWESPKNLIPMAVLLFFEALVLIALIYVATRLEAHFRRAPGSPGPNKPGRDLDSDDEYAVDRSTDANSTHSYSSESHETVHDYSSDISDRSEL